MPLAGVVLRRRLGIMPCPGHNRGRMAENQSISLGYALEVNGDGPLSVVVWVSVYVGAVDRF